MSMKISVGRTVEAVLDSCTTDSFTRENVKATVAVLAEDDPMIKDLIKKETQDVVDVIYPVELPTEEEVMTGLRARERRRPGYRAESTASRAGP
ncbi:hypothetical protein QOT17_008573 [Balamuthia mandrillaris]